MALAEVQVADFRNLGQAQIEPSPAINLISGENGSGKTSLLEAVYSLGFGRSFRTHKTNQIIREGADAYTIFARLADAAGEQKHRIGYQRRRDGQSTLRIDGESQQRFSSLARLVPVQLITPEGVELVTGGPRLRRQFMDWGLFHVEQSYFKEWLGFSRLLKQRNQLLRSGRYHADGGVYWDKPLADQGEKVTWARQAYLAELNNELNEFCQQFLPEYEFEFRLLAGWNEHLSLAEALDDKLEQDMKHGFTSVGPGKAEWQIKVKSHSQKVDARERLSRGQLKLLVAALRLVQGAHYQRKKGQACIYLVDDLPAELDPVRQAKLCEALRRSGSQVFVTAIEKEELLPHFNDTSTQVFHVEHGAIQGE